MLDELRGAVLEGNLALPAHDLVRLTWGNVSAIDRDSGLVAIKGSGVAYERMTADDIAVVDLEGNRVWGARRPSTDTPTHVALYRAFESIGAIVHTHSTWATAWAQSGRAIPILGTTHADLYGAPIPITRPLTDAEVADDYEQATGRALVELIGEHGADRLPAALVRGHGPFAWGADLQSAVENAATLEEVARLALLTTLLSPDAPPLPDPIRRKHFERKHGPHAYYGQTS